MRGLQLRTLVLCGPPRPTPGSLFARAKSNPLGLRAAAMRRLALYTQRAQARPPASGRKTRSREREFRFSLPLENPHALKRPTKGPRPPLWISPQWGGRITKTPASIPHRTSCGGRTDASFGLTGPTAEVSIETRHRSDPRRIFYSVAGC